MEDIECPYCNHSQAINHDDGYGFEENKLHKQTCTECDNIFGYNTEVIYTYSAKETPCLNSDPPSHQWRLTNTFPREYTQMFCQDCEERRPLTPQEMDLYGDYFAWKIKLSEVKYV